MKFRNIYIRIFAVFALAWTLASYGDAATLLPPGSISFTDNNGNPLSGGQVYFYIPGTTVPKSTYQNNTATVLNSNPVILDSSGRAVIYGTGSYQQTVKDSNGNLIWSQITSDTSSTSYSWAGKSSGSPNAQTLTAPNFSLSDGQVVGFIAGFTNTGALTVTINNGSPLNVVKATRAGAVALGGGEVVSGNQYEITYSALNGNVQLVAYPFPAVFPVTGLTGLGANVLTALQADTNSGAGAILTFQPPQIFVVTSGSGTYITPTGAKYLEIDLIGAGSGGAGGGSGTSGGAGGAGGNTSFGTSFLNGSGGAATPAAGSTTYPTPANATGGDLNVSGALGGAPMAVSTSNVETQAGGFGAGSPYGGPSAGGTSLSGASSVIPATASAYGAGGGGGVLSANAAGWTGWGGNAGGYLTRIVASPAPSYSYSVGAAGAAGTAGTSGIAGAPGSVGILRVIAKFQ